MRKSLVVVALLYLFIVGVAFLLKSFTGSDQNSPRVANILEQSFVPESPESPTDDELLEVARGAGAEEELTKLVIEDIVPGDGLMAEPGDTVSVHYESTYEDGTVIDDSEGPGREAFQFILGEGHVIEGWERGIPGMRVGGVRRLTVPADLAYGGEGFGVIPPDTTLVFEIELLSVFK